jgi:predicted AAA+ superfamily ATPase
MLDPRFEVHNLHRSDPALFRAHDPHLRRLAAQPLPYRSPLLARLPVEREGIFTLCGGRQVGKTTLLKQWMADLLERGVAPSRVSFLTGELIDDHHALVRLVQEVVAERRADEPLTIVVDEVTYVRDWDRGVKFLADAGLLERVCLMLTGSDSVVIRDARARLPGRRGVAEQVDFTLHPLSFREATLLAHGVAEAEASLIDAEAAAHPEALVERLFAAFDAYLLHGGFLTAMNDLAGASTILPATYRTYSDWIRGDVLKRGKSERYLREVLGAIRDRLGSQVTWNALASDLSIDHPTTVADYVELLSSMEAVFVQPALVEHTLSAAPKKARKVMFADPFIHHAIDAWLSNEAKPYEHGRDRLITDPEWTSRLVEAMVVTHFRRHGPTFYIKAKGEVDVALVRDGGFLPVEVKWTSQLRAKDLAQIASYPNGRVWARTRRPSMIQGLPVEPLPVALFRLDTTVPFTL